MLYTCFSPSSVHPAGSGKTLIAALLLLAKRDELRAGSKRAAFLAPTVPLVLQVGAHTDSRHTLTAGTLTAGTHGTTAPCLPLLGCHGLSIVLALSTCRCCKSEA